MLRNLCSLCKLSHSAFCPWASMKFRKKSSSFEKKKKELSPFFGRTDEIHHAPRVSWWPARRMVHSNKEILPSRQSVVPRAVGTMLISRETKNDKGNMLCATNNNACRLS